MPPGIEQPSALLTLRGSIRSSYLVLLLPIIPPRRSPGCKAQQARLRPSPPTATPAGNVPPTGAGEPNDAAEGPSTDEAAPVFPADLLDASSPDDPDHDNLFHVPTPPEIKRAFCCQGTKGLYLPQIRLGRSGVCVSGCGGWRRWWFSIYKHMVEVKRQIFRKENKARRKQNLTLLFGVRAPAKLEWRLLLQRLPPLMPRWKLEMVLSRLRLFLLTTAADSERSGALSIVVHIAAFSTTSTARPMMASATPPALACDLPLTVVRSL
ncbi:hypothetical protein FPQ18DRAFT_308334 [Pyronema domesticum]|nr:hypothetical protein FPQ18DRAFT_308334 [Pyronema domesticum]